MRIVDRSDDLIRVTFVDIAARSEFLGFHLILLGGKCVIDRQRLFGPGWADAEFKLSCVKPCIPEMSTHDKAYGEFLID